MSPVSYNSVDIAIFPDFCGSPHRLKKNNSKFGIKINYYDFYTSLPYERLERQKQNLLFASLQKCLLGVLLDKKGEMDYVYCRKIQIYKQSINFDDIFSQNILIKSTV